MKHLALLAVLAFASPVFAVQFDTDVPQNIQKQMSDDLDFMGSIQAQSASALGAEIFNNLDGRNLRSWFDTRVTSVGLDDCGGGKAVACVMPSFFGKTDKMWLTQNYIKFSHPQIARLMVVYHEARHTEDQNSNWGHATCPTPFKDAKGNDMKSIWTGASLAGEPACDVTAYGSYGSSTILLKNVAKFCESCTEKVKLDASIYSSDQLGRVINASAKSAIENDIQ